MSDLPALLPRRHALLNWGVLLAFAAALLTMVALLATFLAAIGHGRGPAWAQGTLTVGTWLVENVRANGLPGALVFLLALLLNVLSLTLLGALALLALWLPLALLRRGLYRLQRRVLLGDQALRARLDARRQLQDDFNAGRYQAVIERLDALERNASADAELIRLRRIAQRLLDRSAGAGERGRNERV